MSLSTEDGASQEVPLTKETLDDFIFERILSESTATGSVYLLGNLHNATAILHVQRTLLPSDIPEIMTRGLETFNVFLDNRPYFSAHALIRRTADPSPDLQVKVIWPATPAHIAKYSTQERYMITESPQLYQQAVIPYIESFPPDRLEWVYNILEGRKEAERILYRNDDAKDGFILLPDLKWDGTSINALYLTAIVWRRDIRTLRDLRKEHIGMLKDIRAQAKQVVQERYSVGGDRLRMFIHYQPSYYHFHVHIVHIYNDGSTGMAVGQAHLLDDVISMLELAPEDKNGSIYAKMTLTYPLGTEHKLLPRIRAAQVEQVTMA